MLNPDPPKHTGYSRPARNSRFLIALIIVGGFLVAFQYTQYALFSSEKTSLLWGMLTGLVIGGWIFGWLKKPWP